VICEPYNNGLRGEVLICNALGNVHILKQSPVMHGNSLRWIKHIRQNEQHHSTLTNLLEHLKKILLRKIHKISPSKQGLNLHDVHHEKNCHLFISITKSIDCRNIINNDNF